ncbi:uncharacterized protein LOC132736337 [Ruditapes philippinarum]|uniref:uncharacterized protein LOC132736337 n=1 Tax=Ruditapes philippinarum TaxID=129788 RepID=UPI00295B0FAF|nr:uncharacterized protein LOC132736337 [Ruditapes philippinarum]
MENISDADKHSLSKSETETLDEDKAELLRISKKVSLMLYDLKVNKEIAEQNRHIVQNARTNARDNIRKLRMEVNDFFNKLENAVDKKVENMRSDDFQTLSILSSENEDLNKKLVIISNYIDKHIKEGKVVTDIDKVRKEIRDLETSIRKLSIDNNVHEYTFEAEERIKDMMKHVKRLGDLILETEKKRTVIRMSEISLNDKCENERLIPFLSGLAFVSEDHIVATDYENRCIKLISVPDDKIVSVLPVLTEPWDVAKVKSDQLAVTLPLKKKIQFLTVKSTSLEQVSEINLKSECRGIESKREMLFVSFIEPAKVEIIDLKGHVKKSFEFDEMGYELFSWPGYIALCPENPGSSRSYMYVSDKDRNTVTCLSEEGKVIAVYGGDVLKGPRGVSVDNGGHVFVCGRASNDLCQIMVKSGKIEYLLERSQGLKQPHGIVCHGNRVFISSCGEKNIKSWEIV